MVDVFKETNVRFQYHGQPYRYRLANVDNPYSVAPRPMFGASILTGEADYSNMRPDEVVPLVIQNDWRRGFQDDDYEDSRKYAHSANCDARFKGKVLLSPKQLSALAFPASAATTVPVPNGTFEDWPAGTANGDTADPRGWTGSTGGEFGHVKCDTDQEHGGTYCVELYTDENDYAKVLITLPFDTTMQGKTYTVTFWAMKSAAGLDTAYGKFEDGGTDGGGSSDGTTTTNVTATSMTSHTIAHTFSTDATKAELYFYANENSSDNFSLFVDDVTISRSDTPFGTVTQIVDFNGTLVVAAGSTLVKSTDGATLATVVDFGATITHLEVWNGYLFVFLGQGDTTFYTSDLSTFTASYGQYATTDYTVTTAAYVATDTNIDVGSTAQFTAGDYVRWENEVCSVTSVTDGDTMVLARGKMGTTAVGHASGTTIYLLSDSNSAYYAAVYADNLAISPSGNTVTVSDNPLNDGTPFSVPYTIGPTDYDITYLKGDGSGNLFVRKTDSLYQIDGDTVREIMPEVKSSVSSTTYPLEIWKGDLFVPAGANELYRYKIASAVVEDISPVQYAQGDKDMDGRILSMCWDAHYFYVAILNGGEIEILAGRDETVDGSTSWVWHPIWEITEDDVTAMCVMSATGSKVLYAGTDTKTNGILKFQVPQSYSDPLIEAGYQVTTSGSFVPPWYTTEFVENDKYWDVIFVAAYNFSGYTSVRVSYQLEGDGEWDDSDDWTEIGFCQTSDQFSGTGATLVYPPEQVTKFTIGKTSRKIRFKFELKAALDGSTTDEYSPVLTRIRVDGRVESSLAGTSLRKKNISCVLELSGGELINWNSVKGQLADLLLLEAATEPIDFEGPDCVPRKVRFAQEGLSERLARRGAEKKESEFTALVVLEEV